LPVIRKGSFSEQKKRANEATKSGSSGNGHCREDDIALFHAIN